MAAIGVVFLHIQERLPQLGFHHWPLTGKLFLLVDFFFMLSGIVLAHVYRARFSGRFKSVDVADFLVARLARCWPMILLAAVLAFVANRVAVDVGMKPTPLDHALAGLGIEMLALSGWFDRHWLNPPSWSLTAEFTLYMVAPWLIWAVSRLPTRILWLLVLTLPLVPSVLFPLTSRTFVSETGLVPLFGEYLYFFGPEAPWFWFVKGPFILTRAIPMFLVGLAIYGLWRSNSLAHPAAHSRLPFYLCVISVVGMMAVDGPRLLILMGFVALVITSLGVGDALTRLFDIRLFRWMGDISLGIYLLHFPVLDLFEAGYVKFSGSKLDRMPISEACLFFIAAATAILLLASLLYLHYEAPVRRACRKLWRERKFAANEVSIWMPRSPEKLVAACVAVSIATVPAGIVSQGWILFELEEGGSAVLGSVQELERPRRTLLKFELQGVGHSRVPVKVSGGGDWIASIGPNRRHTLLAEIGESWSVVMQKKSIDASTPTLEVTLAGKRQALILPAGEVSR